MIFDDLYDVGGETYDFKLKFLYSKQKQDMIQQIIQKYLMT